MPVYELKSTFGGKVACTAIPTLQSFAGGQVWSRRGFNVIGMWKPERGAINKTTGLPFAENEAMVKILKSKPKGSGSLGFVYLYFDWKKNRYYEMYEDEMCYAYDYLKVVPKEKVPVQEIVGLTGAPKKSEEVELPF